MQTSIDLTLSMEKEGRIASVDNLKKQKVFIFNSFNDTLVGFEGGAQNEIYFKHFGADLKVNFDF